jgi:hypothetical protein
VRVTIPRGEVPPDRLDSFLEWLRLEATVRQSTFAEDEADKIADEAKRSWWDANKHRFVKPEKR